MNIVIYSHYFLPSYGGVEKTTLLLAKFLSESGHQTTVITKTPASREEKWPFRVIRKPTIRQMLTELRRADIIQMQGFVPLPFFISKLLGRPVVWAHHGYDLTCPKQIGWRDGRDMSFELRQCADCLLRDHSPMETIRLILLLQVKRLFRRSADAHVAPSEYLLVREGLKGRVIPNGVDPQVYSPGLEEKMGGRILFVGRLIEEKGASVLLEAFNLLTKKGGNHSLEIVGNGYNLNRLRQMVLERGLDGRVCFSTQVPETELVGKIRHASVVCAPTLNAEPFGIVGLEAMSCGTLLVASDRGGFREFSEGIAFLVTPDDAGELARVLAEATSKGEVSERIEVGRHRVLDRYDYRTVGAEYLRLYKEVINDRRGPA